VIVQKVYAHRTTQAFYALPNDDPFYVTAAYVRGSFRKIGETHLCELYQ